MTRAESRSTVVANALWGMWWGPAFGAALTLVATTIYAMAFLSGASVEVPLGGVVLVYLGGGMVSGLLVGLLRPVTRSHVGAALVGIVAAVPVALPIRLLRSGVAPWTTVDTLAVSICAVLLGGTIGWRYRAIFGGPT